MSSKPSGDTGPFLHLVRGLLAALVIVAPLAGLLYWYLSGQTAEHTPTSGVVPPPLVGSAERALSDLDRELIKAQRHTAELRLVSPPEDNALETYLDVARRFPQDARAGQALDELLPLAVDVAEVELARGRLDEAARIVELLARAYPDSFRIPVLAQRVAEARTSAEVEAARNALEREAETQRSAEAETPARLADMRGETAPGTAAQAETAPVPASRHESATVAPAVLPENETTERSPDASSPSSGVAIDVSAPISVDAAIVREDAPRLYTADDLRIVAETAPGYPPMALRRNIEGWVEVEFFVQPDGTVTDVAVVAAEPRNVFDREAVRAVSRWRFAPYDAANAPTQGIRARKTVQFSLQQSG